MHRSVGAHRLARRAWWCRSLRGSRPSLDLDRYASCSEALTMRQLVISGACLALSVWLTGCPEKPVAPPARTVLQGDVEQQSQKGDENAVRTQEKVDQDVRTERREERKKEEKAPEKKP